MDNNDFIDFTNIRLSFGYFDTELFVIYLKEVFKDLSERSESSKKKGVSKITFYDYVKLPIFIAEKLFNSLDMDNDGFLNSKEFVDNFYKLYMGNFDETFEMIFTMLDFNKDGIVNKGDVKLLLSYLPLKTDKTKMEYKYQMDSFEEIDEIIKETFSERETLRFDAFKKSIESKKSDIYLQIICFLYQRKPFNEENVSIFKKYRRKSAPEDKIFLSPQTNKRIPSPSRKTIFSPTESFLKLTLLRVDDSPEKKKKQITPEISGITGMIRMPNQKIVNSKTNEVSEDINSIIKNSKNIFNSPSAFLKKPNKVSDFNLEDNLIKIDELSLNDNSDTEPSSEKSIVKEGLIYKISTHQKLKKYWLVLVGTDIYYYKNDMKEDLQGMHNLSGSFVKDLGEMRINDEKLYHFSIQFSSKTRNYYCKSKSELNKWMTVLKEAIGYNNFFDFYEMLDDIGEGKFGLVKLGIHKKTKERVAIKIIKKESMSTNDVELVKSEIDIMKLCMHPNVVRLLDHFENFEYIFIIMEYLPGGDLGDYLNRVKFNVSEERAAEIMNQLALGLKYLHDYGIVHRDLKPENIMLTKNTDDGQIKIMDFGLSKIMGPLEKAADGFGTLSFVAPEVLIRQPYNRQIDIWSLGVILYHILSGTLPFDDENDNEERIAKMTVFEDVQFPSKFWNKRSTQVIDLISLCLIKDPNKRICVEDFLKHSWIKKYNK